MVFKQAQILPSKCKQGFTLIEILIAMTISLMFMAAASTTFILFLKIERSTTAMNDIEYQVRNFRKWFGQDVREAKVFRINSSERIDIKLLDNSIVTYQINPSNSKQLLRQYQGEDVYITQDLNSISFSYNSGDRTQILASISLDRQVMPSKNIRTDITTLFRKRN